MQDYPETDRPPALRSGYRTAKVGGRVLAGAGWTLSAAGIAGAAAAAWYQRGLESFVIAAVSAGSGLLMVVAGQTLRAAIDSADQTREILRLLQSGPLQWATRPPEPLMPARVPERSAEQAAWLKSPSATISPEMQAAVASENVSPCVNPFCGRLLPEGSEVCPHCRTRQKRLSF